MSEAEFQGLRRQARLNQLPDPNPTRWYGDVSQYYTATGEPSEAHRFQTVFCSACGKRTFVPPSSAWPHSCSCGNRSWQGTKPKPAFPERGTLAGYEGLAFAAPPRSESEAEEPQDLDNERALLKTIAQEADRFREEVIRNMRADHFPAEASRNLCEALVAYRVFLRVGQ